MLKFKHIGVFLFLLVFITRSDCFSSQDGEYQLEPIVVTKENIHLTRSYSLSVQDIESLPYNSVIESLNTQPIDLQSRTPGADIQTDFSLRGSSFQGVLMLINGQRINDPQTGHYNCDVPLTREDIRRIDVMPGVGSSVFGPDAIGGAVNFLVKKPQENKQVLELAGGDFGSGSGLFSISRKFDILGLRYSFEKSVSSGATYDTEFKKFTNSLVSSLNLPNGSVDLNLGYQQKTYGAFDFYTPGSNYPSKEWTRTWVLDSSADLVQDELLVRPSFLWRRHYDKFMLDKTEVRSLYVNHHRTDILTPGIYLQRQAGVIGKFGAGVEYGQEHIVSTNLGKHVRSHKSIYIDDSKDLTDQLFLGASARFDDYDTFGNTYTGSAALKYKLDDNNNINAGVSKSSRIPSFTELYYSDPTTLGNGGLSPERSINYQLGYGYQRQELSAGLTLFFRQEDDFIDWVKHAPSQAKWQVENITRAQVPGVEGYAKFRINEYLQVNTNYTYVNKRTNQEGLIYKYGPNYCRHLANLSFVCDFPFGTQEFGLTYKNKPGRGGWVVAGAHFSYNINKNARVFVDISNIFDKEYEDIAGIPQPSRWAQGGLRVDW